MPYNEENALGKLHKNMLHVKRTVLALLSIAIVSIALIGCGNTTTQQTSQISTVSPTNALTYSSGTSIKVGKYGTMYSVQGAFKDGTPGSVQITPLSSRVYATLPAPTDLCPSESDKGTAFFVIKLRLNGRGALNAMNFKASDQQLTQLNTVASSVGDEEYITPFNTYLTVGKDYMTDFIIEIKDASTVVTLSYEEADMSVAVWNLSINRQNTIKVTIPQGCLNNK